LTFGWVFVIIAALPVLTGGISLLLSQLNDEGNIYLLLQLIFVDHSRDVTHELLDLTRRLKDTKEHRALIYLCASWCPGTLALNEIAHPDSSKPERQTAMLEGVNV